jgi:hypothetical protein
MTTVENKWTDLQDGVLSRSVIIDFEGFEKKPPTLCGVLKDGEFRQVVFDEIVSPAISHTKKKDPGRLIVVEDRQDFLDSLVQMAFDENRKIVAFSDREQKVLGGERVADIYIDALHIAKNWRKTLRPKSHKEAMKKQKDNSRRKKTSKQARADHYDHVGTRLVDYLEEIGEKAPSSHGRKKTTKWLKTVICALEKKGDREPLAKGQRGSWTKFLKHNERDVKGLHKLLETILTEYTEGVC